VTCLSVHKAPCPLSALWGRSKNKRQGDRTCCTRESIQVAVYLPIGSLDQWHWVFSLRTSRGAIQTMTVWICTCLVFLTKSPHQTTRAQVFVRMLTGQAATLPVRVVGIAGNGHIVSVTRASLRQHPSQPQPSGDHGAQANADQG